MYEEARQKGATGEAKLHEMLESTFVILLITRIGQFKWMIPYVSVYMIPEAFLLQALFALHVCMYNASLFLSLSPGSPCRHAHSQRQGPPTT